MTKNYVIRRGKRIEIGTVEPKVTSKRNKDDRHVGFPLGWMRRMVALMRKRSVEQFAVALWLHRRRAIHKRDLFPVSNRELELELGISRKVKYMTLRCLEEAGAISLVRDGKQAIQVRILW
jgi:hypothetical protein